MGVIDEALIVLCERDSYTFTPPNLLWDDVAPYITSGVRVVDVVMSIVVGPYRVISLAQYGFLIPVVIIYLEPLSIAENRIHTYITPSGSFVIHIQSTCRRSNCHARSEKNAKRNENRCELFLHFSTYLLVNSGIRKAVLC